MGAVGHLLWRVSYCDSTMLAALVAIISLAGCLGQKDGGNFPTYCYDKQAWMAAIDKCYTDQGLTMPQAPKDDGDWGSKDRRDAALDVGSKDGVDVDKEGNWTKPDGDWSKDTAETKPTSAPGVTAVKDGVTWVVDKNGVWVKLESLGRRDLDKDVDWSKDNNWTKPAGNWSKDINETKPTTVPGVTAVKDGVTWVVDKDGVWVKLESLGRRDLDKDIDWSKDDNLTKPDGDL